ncbi:MAG: hypothetical protein Q7R30_15665 [Acidobacteriota bacterium]|nr:hypothetical protein [Acidobacteriota bacterium]
MRVAELNFDSTAIVDTAAPWSIIEPELAESAGLLELEGVAIPIKTWFGTAKGKLVPVAITLLAKDGVPLNLEATVFVSADWPKGWNFIGYHGFLERIRFAIEPSPTNYFYFGPAD